MHDMRRRRSESLAVCRVYARRQESTRTLRFLQENLWLTCRRITETSPNMVHMQRQLQAVDFVTPPPPAFSLSLKLPRNHGYKGKLTFHTQCTYLGGYQSALHPMYTTAVLLHPTSILCFSLTSSGRCVPDNPTPIQDHCFVVFCSTTWRQEQEVQFMRSDV